MEAIAMYLFKSAAWLTGFAFVYHLFLRNERFFVPIRLFLLVGLLAAMLFPLITVHYVVNVHANPSTGLVQPELGQAVALPNHGMGWGTWLWAVFAAGVLFCVVRLVWQAAKVYTVIRQSSIDNIGTVKVVSTHVFKSSFTFFSYVFVNPSLSPIEHREIIKHESGHVTQFHWIDLVLSELVCCIQWFNPVAWLYGHYIRQNHEYLADKEVLEGTAEPAVYKAVLINQIMGGEAFRLSHMFNYSLNKKRFKMMNHTVIPSWRKLRVLWALPVIAVLFFAFANPVYRTVNTPLDRSTAVATADSAKQKGVEARPLEGKNVLILLDGKEIDMDAMKQIDPNTIARIDVLKDADFLAQYGAKAKDGVIKITTKAAAAQPNYGSNLDRVEVIGYGVKGDDKPVGKLSVEEGANDNLEQKPYQSVDQMPEYPGGIEALMRFIATNVKYPVEAQKAGKQGRVYVKFVISPTGKVQDAKVVRGVSPLLDDEALRVVNLMPDWTPGKQDGKNVAVEYTLPINFALK